MAKLVTIYGGSGFLGRQIVRLMARDGWRIRIAVRRPNEALSLQTNGTVGQVVPVLCNIRDDESVRAAMAGADVVINCVGVLNSDRRNTFDAVQAEGAERIARIAAQSGVERFVHISAIGADADSRSDYARTKAEGEAAVLHHIPDATILRPSVMFGPGDDLFNRFAAMSGFGLLMPITGGNTKMQPVFVEDVARAAQMAAEGKAQGIYELGGPEVITVRNIVRNTLAQTGKRRGIINLPFPIAGFVGFLGDMVQTLTFGQVTNIVLTRDQVRLLRADNVASPQVKGFADLGITPTAFDVIVPEYLWRFRRNGQYAEITRSARTMLDR